MALTIPWCYSIGSWRQGQTIFHFNYALPYLHNFSWFKNALHTSQPSVHSLSLRSTGQTHLIIMHYLNIHVLLAETNS